MRLIKKSINNESLSFLESNEEKKQIREINLKKNNDYYKAYCFKEDQSFLWNTLYESLLTFSKKGDQNKKVSQQIKFVCHNYEAYGVGHPQLVFQKIDEDWFKLVYAKDGIDKLNESHVDWMTIDECIKQINWNN